MHYPKVLSVCILLCTLLISLNVSAQGQLAATLEVLSPGVVVQRFNTVNAIEVTVEAIVGVGDLIRTDETGSARITFFADGTDTELMPNTEYVIQQFEGDEDTFIIAVEVLVGETQQRLGQLLDSDSSYNVDTPGMLLAARGTVFDIRVEDDGRAAMLVSEGNVDASADSTSADASTSANVPTGFGVRSEDGGPLSDVVQATTFDELDAALDGCTATASTPDDVRINVRIGPSLEQPRVGTIAASEIGRFFGTTEDGQWFRIAFRGGFGWILTTDNTLQETCAGLRLFPASQLEDPQLYEFIGDPIDIQDLTPPEVPDEASEDAETEGETEMEAELPADGDESGGQ